MFAADFAWAASCLVGRVFDALVAAIPDAHVATVFIQVLFSVPLRRLSTHLAAVGCFAVFLLRSPGSGLFLFWRKRHILSMYLLSDPSTPLNEEEKPSFIAGGYIECVTVVTGYLEREGTGVGVV